MYAEMPDFVKKILNWTYLADNTYNDIVLRLEQKMRLNGLGVSDETRLVTLNKIEVNQKQRETKKVEDKNKEAER